MSRKEGEGFLHVELSGRGKSIRDSRVHVEMKIKWSEIYKGWVQKVRLDGGDKISGQSRRWSSSKLSQGIRFNIVIKGSSN